jgi:glutamate-ammonia-ligase adenylyltransferase
MQRVSAHYADLFADAPSLAAPEGNLVFTGTDDDPGTVRSLDQMGFASPSGVISTVRAWHTGRYRALRTARARQLLTDLVPPILKGLSQTGNPEAAMAHFDRFLSRLPAGVQFLSLLRAHPELLSLLARIMGSAPALAETLSRNVGLVDTLLEPGDSAPDDPEDIREHCERELSRVEEPDDHEGILDAVRRFANERKFDIGVGLLGGVLDIERVGQGLTDVAETALRALLPAVERDVATRHGVVPGSGMAVIAMGKLGARELTFGSDLDLIFIYDDRCEAKESDGDRPLATGPYFTRLSQRYISAITTLTTEGRLYEVDMRLRPSGNKGAVAVPLSAYRRYMSEDAWTWEMMAATRARIIAGPGTLCTALRETLDGVIACPRDRDDLRAAVLDMRVRIDAQHGTRDIWAVKHVRGGLVDLEFILQFLILANAEQRPGLATGHVPTALARLGEAGLLPPAVTGELQDAYRVLKGVQTLLRLCYDHRFIEPQASTDFRRLAATTLNRKDFADVRRALEDAEATIYRSFQEIVGDSQGRGSKETT